MASIHEKIAAALQHKDQGNDAFKQADIKKALTQYHLAILGLSGLDQQMAGVPMMSAMQPGASTATDAQKSEIKVQLAVVYANMAACHLKNGNYKRAIEVCNSALKQDPDNVKAKFRRGQAKLQEGNLAGAEVDFESLGEKVPGVKAELEKLKKKTKEAQEKQRKTMGGFLSRGRILTPEDEAEDDRAKAAAAAEAAASSSSSGSRSGAASTSDTSADKSSSKARRVPQAKNVVKPKPTAPREEPTTWSGTAPKIQELEDGEE
ncbi:hypothetical protein BGZ99_005939 [Dissophora globulifera]|uniref:TPR-like protein n=1 Tax=Dissophora globulifera TaxID=979702 RepID=A0A9P6RFR0_9FUNG|nr:hypothetical protein BGZ99_005939 [Dissophora globulifera]